MLLRATTFPYLGQSGSRPLFDTDAFQPILRSFETNHEESETLIHIPEIRYWDPNGVPQSNHRVCAFQRVCSIQSGTPGRGINLCCFYGVPLVLHPSEIENHADLSARQGTDTHRTRGQVYASLIFWGCVAIRGA